MHDSYDPFEGETERWFALEVKFGHERVVTEVLQAKKYEAFSPRAVHRGRDKQLRETESPLFPGYTFAKFDARFRLPILMTPGVRCVVGCGRIPVPLDQNEIQAIRDVLSSRAPVEQCPYLPAGTRVRIIKGSLTGLEGVLVQTKSSSRVVLSVSLIRQSIRVEVDPDMLSSDIRSISVSRFGLVG